MVSLNKRKLAVLFGGSGFIGQHLAHLLNTNGYDIVVADIESSSFTLGVYIQCDVREEIEIELPEVPDLVINLAAIHRTPGHSPNEYYETNILGAMNISNWCTAVGVRNQVLISSIAVYGPSGDEKTESSELNPVSDYGKSKMIAERIGLLWESTEPENKLTIIRPSVIFGPGENGNFTRMARGLRLKYFFYPAGKQITKSSGYVKDLTRCIQFCSELSGKSKIFNFGFPSQHTIEDISRSMCQIGNFRLPISLPIVFLGRILIRSSGVLKRIGERIMKLDSPTIISSSKLLQEGFHWLFDLESGLSDWYSISKFDKKSWNFRL